MQNAAVTLTGISKTYHSLSGSPVHALRSVDLTVHEGEIVVLIGPTGCGKTTLLNILAGLESHDSGGVALAGNIRQGHNMPCVFQHYTLFPWRSLSRNVAFGLEMRGLSRKERRRTAETLLAKFGLTEFEDACPHELSGGMRQRAAIAQALAVEPRMLLMDEPFGAVDDSTRIALQEMLIEIWQEKRTTILFVTHNIDEAVALADRVVIMSGRPGEVVREIAIGLPRPRDRTSKEFTDRHLQLRQSMSGSIILASGLPMCPRLRTAADLTSGSLSPVERMRCLTLLSFFEFSSRVAPQYLIPGFLFERSGHTSSSIGSGNSPSIPVSRLSFTRPLPMSPRSASAAFGSFFLLSA